MGQADRAEARRGDSTGIWDEGMRQAEPQEANQFYGGANPMRAAMQIAKSVESLNRQGQEGKEPADEQTVGVMAADMLQPVAILRIVEALIHDFPTDRKSTRLNSSHGYISYA